MIMKEQQPRLGYGYTNKNNLKKKKIKPQKPIPWKGQTTQKQKS